ncbi:GntR family transcriptional regulator [Rhizobium sp. YJ-22]|uniref:GntR family transcriptional regulator n=1 Tax=Rhizobium sp. YJ-22 TaxID=3037556 RepID=UPI002412239D|nr:GntR family transcriptional regulator [Rhizobium sp. YJ-22]MDG3579359.1 GntR family transcriptional regulator [Rhizobium sp. YJ-22]
MMKGGKSALHETLKRQILTLELEPDGDLDEVKLSEEYGISRTPVRDVLRQLAVDGYVDIRENRGARVVPMNHSTLRDFFLVAPMIYEAIGRLAVQNCRAGQLDILRACQERFRAAVMARDAEKMVMENNRFHELIGEMAGSAFLKPTLNRLLIDHARIGHTFFRPATAEMEDNLAKSCLHHDRMIEALAQRDETAMVNLVFEHWDLSRQNMELFIAPKALTSETNRRVAARRDSEESLSEVSS